MPVHRPPGCGQARTSPSDRWLTPGSKAPLGAAEVNNVVGLVTTHLHERPKESLGVITMGIKHAEHISEALRRARAAQRAGYLA